MLQNIRDRTSGWLTWIIVVAICVMFALWGVSYYLSDMVGDHKAVAKVNGVSINQAQFQLVYQQLSAQQNPQQPPLSSDQLRQQAMNQLIQQTLLVQAAQKAGITFSDAQIDQAIYQMPALQQNGQFSMQLYQQLLQNLNLTTEQLRAELKDNALINQYRIGVIGSDFALPSEINQFGAMLNAKRSFGYVMIPASTFINSTVVSDAQAEQYYQAHLSDYMAPEQVKVAYLELSQDQLAQKIQITDAQAQAYYQQHKANYVTPEQRQLSQITLKAGDTATANKIEQALTQGQSFAALAKQYSQDPVSAPKGGSMGWVSANDVSGAFKTAAFALTKVGAVSAPVTTSYGLQIIQLNGLKPAVQQPYTQVKAQVMAQLKTQEVQAQFAKLTNELANITFEHSDSLAAASKKLHLPIQTTEPFDQNGGTGIAANPAVIKAAFSDTVLTQGNNSSVINISNTQAVVLHVVQDYPKHQLAFAAVKAQVVKTLQQQYAAQKAQQLAQSMMQSIQKGINPVRLAIQQHLSWIVLSQVKKDAKNVNSAVLQAVFAQPVPGASAIVGVVALPNEAGYAVYQLTKVTPGTVDAKSVQQYQYILQNLFAAQIYQDYLNALQANATVKMLAQ